MRINNHINLFNSIRQPSKVIFRGVSLGSFDDKNRPDILEKESDDGYDISKKFEEGLAAIKLAAKKQRDNVYGLLRKRKIDMIQFGEDKEVTGFLKAQKITIDEQQKIVELLKVRIEEMKKWAETQERLQRAEQALIMAEKKLEIAKEIEKNKDSHVGFDAIAGYDAEKFILTSSFIDLVEEERSGLIVNVPNGILFFGPIGNGKTSFAKAFANSAGCEFCKAKPNSSARTKKEREESFYKDLLKKAETAQEHFMSTGQRTIILADEFDRYAKDNSSIAGKLKKFLSECSEQYHCTVFATTNNPLDIALEVRSEERMPIKVCIDPPDKVNAALVFNHYLSGLSNVSMSEIDLEELAEETCAFLPDSALNNSQIEDICKICVKNHDTVTQNDLLYYIRISEPAIDKEDLSKYKLEKEELIGTNDD